METCSFGKCKHYIWILNISVLVSCVLIQLKAHASQSPLRRDITGLGLEGLVIDPTMGKCAEADLTSWILAGLAVAPCTLWGSKICPGVYFEVTQPVTQSLALTFFTDTKIDV